MDAPRPVAFGAGVSFYVYILQSSRGDYYIGHTQDPAERLRRHQSGRGNYTKSRGPWQLVYTECFETRSQAMTRERALKEKHSHGYLAKLIVGWVQG